MNFGNDVSVVEPLTKKRQINEHANYQDKLRPTKSGVSFVVIDKWGANNIFFSTLKYTRHSTESIKYPCIRWVDFFFFSISIQ